MAVIRIVQVAIQKGGGGYNLVPLVEYKKMQSVVRINLIKEKKVQFIDEQGGVVPTVTALKSMINSG